MKCAGTIGSATARGAHAANLLPVGIAIRAEPLSTARGHLGGGARISRALTRRSLAVASPKTAITHLHVRLLACGWPGPTIHVVEACTRRSDRVGLNSSHSGASQAA